MPLSGAVVQVNSVDFAPNGYPYGTISSCAGASLTADAGSYAPSQMASGPVMSALPISYARPSQTYPILATKPFNPSHYTGVSGYGDDGAEAGSYVTPSMISQPHEPQGSAALFGPQEGLRAWNPFSNTSKPSGALLMEGNPPPYGGGHVPLVSSTGPRGSLAPPESSPLFPGLSSLSSSLPAPGPAGERFLPRPQQHGGSGSGSLANGGNIHDPLSYASWDSLPLRPTQQDWTYETRSPVGEQEAKRTSSGATTTAYGISNGKGSLASSQDANLAFESLPASAAPQESAAPTSSYSMSGSAIPGMSKASYDGPDMKSAVSSAGDLSLGCGSSPDLYSYTTASNYRHGSHGSRSSANEGTLVSGQTYTRLHPGQPVHPSPLIPLRRDSRESCTRSTHRAPAGSFRA
ncbi:MAG: hypothetical protein M1815_002671 [Lichina confinis]|nr:MAG: hypothetical protein M1815_002671 [Lichina confinis]